MRNTTAYLRPTNFGTALLRLLLICAFLSGCEDKDAQPESSPKAPGSAESHTAEPDEIEADLKRLQAQFDDIKDQDSCASPAAALEDWLAQGISAKHLEGVAEDVQAGFKEAIAICPQAGAVWRERLFRASPAGAQAEALSDALLAVARRLSKDASSSAECDEIRRKAAVLMLAHFSLFEGLHRLRHLSEANEASLRQNMGDILTVAKGGLDEKGCGDLSMLAALETAVVGTSNIRTSKNGRIIVPALGKDGEWTCKRNEPQKYFPESGVNCFPNDERFFSFRATWRPREGDETAETIIAKELERRESKPSEIKRHGPTTVAGVPGHELHTEKVNTKGNLRSRRIQIAIIEDRVYEIGGRWDVDTNSAEDVARFEGEWFGKTIILEKPAVESP